MRKVVRAVSEPSRVLPYLLKNLKRKWILYTTGEKNIKNILGNRMELNIDDAGIGSDLILNGHREPVTTAVYVSHIKKLRNELDRPVTIVDLGANIGYYVLAAAGAVDDCSIIAIEVDGDNIKNLERNISLNDYEDRVDVIQKAVGNQHTVEELAIAPHSNRHTLQVSNREKNPQMVKDTTEVKVEPLTSILEQKGYELSSIDVLRMDVEGYEAAVFRGAEEILRSVPLLIQVELHPALMDDSDIRYIRSLLKDINAELLSAAQDDNIIPIPDIDEISEFGWIELVVQTDPE
jgi:FkbM family methyltransferase